MRSPIENSPDHLLQLGIIAARWASVDTILAQLLAIAIGDEKTGEAVYFAAASQRARLDIVRAAVNSSFEQRNNRDAINEKLDVLSDLWGKRNDLLHSPAIWRIRPGKKSKAKTFIANVIRPANVKNNRREIPLTLEYLKGHCQRLSDVGDELYKIAYSREISVLERAKKHPSWRGKPPPPVQTE